MGDHSDAADAALRRLATIRLHQELHPDHPDVDQSQAVRLDLPGVGQSPAANPEVRLAQNAWDAWAGARLALRRDP